MHEELNVMISLFKTISTDISRSVVHTFRNETTYHYLDRTSPIYNQKLKLQSSDNCS